MTLRVLPLSIAVAGVVTAAMTGPSARAVLRDAQGREVGTAEFTPAEQGVRVAVRAAHLPPGQHGIHVHAAGRCDPPDFETAGPHFNPQGKRHGLHNPAGAHAGDMPNLTVGPDGTARATFTIRGATLGEGPGSLLGPRGTALVIHAGQDDQKSDPAGNSGARFACGVVERE